MQLNISISLPRLCLSTQSGDQWGNETIGQALLTAGVHIVFTLSALLTDGHFTSESGLNTLFPKILLREGHLGHVSPKYHQNWSIVFMACLFSFASLLTSRTPRFLFDNRSVNLLPNYWMHSLVHVSVCMLLVGALRCGVRRVRPLFSIKVAGKRVIAGVAAGGHPLLCLSLCLSLASKYV